MEAVKNSNVTLKKRALDAVSALQGIGVYSWAEAVKKRYPVYTTYVMSQLLYRVGNGRSVDESATICIENVAKLMMAAMKDKETTTEITK